MTYLSKRSTSKKNPKKFNYCKARGKLLPPDVGRSWPRMSSTSLYLTVSHSQTKTHGCSCSFSDYVHLSTALFAGLRKHKMITTPLNKNKTKILVTEIW